MPRPVVHQVCLVVPKVAAGRRSGVKVQGDKREQRQEERYSGRGASADGRRSAPDWKGDAITGQAALRQRLRRQVKYR